jgi:hypothetical protein
MRIATLYLGSRDAAAAYLRAPEHQPHSVLMIKPDRIVPLQSLKAARVPQPA